MGKCKSCEHYLPKAKYPLQCSVRGMLHKDTCPIYKNKLNKNKG
jgi:hypothetical protein